MANRWRQSKSAENEMIGGNDWVRKCSDETRDYKKRFCVYFDDELEEDMHGRK